MGPEIQSTEEETDSLIELLIYPGKDGSFIYYEDAGDGYEYEKGAFATVPIHWNDQSRQLVFGKRDGSYPGMKEKLDFSIILVGGGLGYGLTEAGEQAVIVEYDGNEQEVSVRVD
ncbi:DUF5110 domain-containing protein [Paenibacillus agaridevorans]|uniref:DUF5110 domain-containing protein n=1 Tax=Paenibacillus agaridevorans TaxID=171404 RepID=UPI001FE8359E|nr:DUF5110 domain-containing protein [Paenibacillus agaridevorans]